MHILMFFLLIYRITTFQFSSITVSVDLKTINTRTTYYFNFDRTKDDNFDETTYQSSLISTTDTIKVIFPAPFVLSSVTCAISVDSGNLITPSCAVVGQAIVVSNFLTTSTAIGKVSLAVGNILNPTPAITSDYFTGTIGSDTSGPGTFQSVVVLQPSQFTSCYSTFNTSTVNSTADMILKFTPTNAIPSTGYITIQFPSNRRWVNDISSTNFMPITSGMSCSNKSTNVLASVQCTGDTIFATVTASNMFNSPINSMFMFSINNFLSPPTNQQSDILVATSYSSQGYKIDTCNFYVSDLTPKVLTNITITNANTASMIVNQYYSLKFTFVLTDTFSQSDTIRLFLPSGSTFNFNSNVSTSLSSNTNSTGVTSNYQSSSSTLFLSIVNPQFNLPRFTTQYLIVGLYRAPPSIQSTSNFVLTIYRNNQPKLTGTATFSAGASTVTGSVTSIASNIVNVNTTYTFLVVLADSISSAGRIRIIFPAVIGILASGSACATVTGTNTTTTPTCTYNTSQNSITLSSLNSSSNSIDPQNLTISITGLKNPSSTAPTSTFSLRTFYRSADTSLVATGTMNGITATAAVIQNSLVSVVASTYVVNDVGVSYSLQCKVVNPIPQGGTFTIHVPSQIYVDNTSAPNSCTININSTSYIPTSCTATTSTGYTIINYTNPFSTDANINTIFIAKISTAFNNPSSTRPTSSFKLYTYNAQGFLIAYIDNAVTVQMSTPAVFSNIGITRSSNKNYELTSYNFVVSQASPYQASSIIIITFPANVVPTATSTCSMTSPSSTPLTCTYSNSVIKINLPASPILASTSLTLRITNIYNPPSFQPTGIFILQSKTSNELYIYSLQTSTPNLNNTTPNTFQSLSYTFTPTIYSQQTTLQLNFNPTDTSRIPAKLRFTLANSFTIGTLACNSFVDFVASCSVVSTNTIQVVGNFTNSLMSFSVTGFIAPSAAVTDYSTIITFDTNNYKMDQQNSTILFTVTCTLPCRTCTSSTQPTTCLSCYNITTITPNIYYDSTSNRCLTTCPSGKYANTATNNCLPCDSNCLTCNNSATFCLSCNQSSTFKVLYVNTGVTPVTQTCLAACPTRMYADNTTNYVCTACVSPCVTCTSASLCLSCISGRYLIGNACPTSCPTGLYIQNPTTNTCDPCTSTCLTCQTTTTTCTSCNSSLLLYQSQCRSTCPSPLVPQNGTCGPCNTSCLTCINDPYNCTSCNTASSLAYLLNGRCLDVCPEGYYRNIGVGACSVCSAVVGLNCNNCSSVSTCFTCNVGFVLFNSTCINYVPPGYVNISGVAQPCTGECSTCSITQSNCTSCLTTNLLINTCYSICPTGYIGLNKICQACISPCRSCTTNTTTCTSCLATITPSVYLSNGRCIPVCPDGTYANNANNSCVACTAPCQYCGSDALCLSCLNGFYLSNQSCLTVCPTGSTGINRICKPCEGNCATCSGATTYCTSCKTNTYLYQLNNSCVTSCGNGLFVDPANQTCIYCLSPCKTCTNTSTTCLSCLTGALYNSQCVTNCPNRYFNQLGICQQCASQCSVCVSLTNCTTCTSGYLYNGFCVSSCPATHAVIVSQGCTRCSGASCHECTSADICTVCDSSYSLLNGACLSQCPASYKSNGTHCVDINQQVLTTPNSFPVPFSIAAAVIVVACLMSKLQFTKTFLPGAVFGFFGVLETGALGFFLYLYYSESFKAQPLPFFIGVASLAYLYLLNVFAFLVQNIIFCNDKQYTLWSSHCPNKTSQFFINLLSIITNHKFRNIMFSKLFTFAVFSAQLQSISKFKVINIFSFLSLLHSGAAIFAAGISIGTVTKQSQLYYECVDVIVVTAINAIMAFFNVMKTSDFFYEMTPEGFQLKKKIEDQEDYYSNQKKFPIPGKDIEDQQGFTSKVYHVNGSNSRSGLNAALMSTQPYKTTNKFKLYDVSSLQDDSFSSLAQRESEKRFEEVSVQAVGMIDRSFAEPEQPPVKEQPKPFEITVIHGHEKSTQTVNFTTIFQKSDKGVSANIRNDQSQKGVDASIRKDGTQKGIGVSFRKQIAQIGVGASFNKGSEIGIQNTIDHGPSMMSQGVGMTQQSSQPSLHDISVQPTYHRMIDQSVQRYQSVQAVDRSVQRTVFFRQDQSMQYASSMKSKPPSVRDISIDNGKPSMKDQSVSYKKVSMKDQSIQQVRSVSNKSIMQRPSLHDQSNQKTIQKVDQQIQNIPQQQQIQIQAVQQYSDKGNQKQVSAVEKSMQFEQSVKDKSVQRSNVVQYDQYTEQIQPSKNDDNKVIFQEDYFQEDQRIDKLKEEQTDQLLLPKQEIKTYQEQLEQRIRDKQKQLNQIKRKVQMQQRKNQQKNIKLQKQPKYFDQAHRIFQKPSKTNNSIDQPSISQQQQKNQKNSFTQPNNNILKKQVKQIQQEMDAQIDKTLEHIQVLDDKEEKKVIKVQFNRNQDVSGDHTQEEFLGMLEEHPSKVIFQNSSDREDNVQASQHGDNEKDSQQLNKGFVRSKNLQNAEDIKNLIQNIPKKTPQFYQSQAQISSGKDGSTNIHSVGRPLTNNNIKKPNSKRNPNFQFQDSDNSYDPIINQPMNPYQPHQHHQHHQPHSFSDMSHTIEQVHPNLNQTTSTTHLKNQSIKNRIKEMIPGSNTRFKKEVPSQSNQKNQSGVRRRFESNSNTQIPKPAKIEQDKGIRRSSLMLVGKSQFTQEGIARKQINRASPLKVAKRWQYENDDKNIIESGGEEQVPHTRVIQSRLVAPIQTDKQIFGFKTSRVQGSEKVIVSNPKRQIKYEDNYGMADQISPFIGEFNLSKEPSKPVLTRNQMEEEFGAEDFQAEPYIQQQSSEDDQSRYKNNIILGQMLSRPANSDLKSYYGQKRRKSRDKSLGKNSTYNQFQSQTQKIYQQKLNASKKR